MKNHSLKCWCDPFNEIISGRKRFEYRKNDRDYKVGDILLLQEWDPDTTEYTGRKTFKSVTSILTKGFGLPEGYCVMSLGEPDEIYESV